MTTMDTIWPQLDAFRSRSEGWPVQPTLMQFSFFRTPVHGSTTCRPFIVAFKWQDTMPSNLPGNSGYSTLNVTDMAGNSDSISISDTVAKSVGVQEIPS